MPLSLRLLMASRRALRRQEEEYDDDEEDDSESGTDSEDDSESGSDSEGDTSSSASDAEPEPAVNLPPTVEVASIPPIDLEVDIQEGIGGGEKGSEEIVKNWVEKGKKNVGFASGDNILPTCPVCMEAWTSEGPHRVCCIPCGHVYGRLCLEKWLRKCGNKGKCPQCNGKFNPNQIINLFAPRIVVPNDDLEKEVISLREENKSLTSERTKLLKEIHEHRELLEEERRSKKQKIRQASLLEFSDQRQKLSTGAMSGSATSPSRIVLQNELSFDGARVMAVDASSQKLVVSSKAPGVPGEHILNKISLLCPRETEKIRLPNNTKTVKDLCILPNGLVALASLGRKLAVFSMTSNNVVLQYDLPAPAWSCSGNDGDANYIYVGLQNGKLLVFDVRRTAQPVQSLDGLTAHPIHTVHSLNNGGTRRVLTGSSVGPCVWDIDQGAERPTLVPGFESDGICISLACGGDNLVATFRRRVDLCQPGTLSSQTLNSSSSPSPPKLGTHILMKRASDGIHFCKDRVGYGNVSEFRMSKSAIIFPDENAPLFAYGDERQCGLRISGLPFFITYTDLKPHKKPVLDLRYASSLTGPGLLGCLSEEKLQIFSCS